MSFLNGERDAYWTETSLVTLHPCEEVRLMLAENGDHYRSLNESIFKSLSHAQGRSR